MGTIPDCDLTFLFLKMYSKCSLGDIRLCSHMCLYTFQISEFAGIALSLWSLENCLLSPFQESMVSLGWVIACLIKAIILSCIVCSIVIGIKNGRARWERFLYFCESYLVLDWLSRYEYIYNDYCDPKSDCTRILVVVCDVTLLFYDFVCSMDQLFVWALIAEIAWTIAWFGSSSIFLPIAHQFLTYHNAIVLVAIYHIFGNISRFGLFWRHWDKKVFFLFGIPSVIATVCGARLSSIVNPSLLKIFLWIVLILFSVYSVVKPQGRIDISPLLARLGGALSGFSAWLIWTGGVLRGAFMTLFGLSRQSYIATITSVALLVDFTRIPIYIGQWFMDQRYYVYIPVLFVIAFVGSWLGKQIVVLINQKLLRTIIFVAIIVGSVLLIYQGWSQV